MTEGKGESEKFLENFRENTGEKYRRQIPSKNLNYYLPTGL